MARRYLRDFIFRAAVFLMILGIYLYDKSLLDITRREQTFWPLNLLWIAVLVSMLAQLNPKSGLTTGCMKQHISGFLPAEHFDREKLAQTVRAQNKGAVKVAVVWLLVNGLFGVLYLRKIFSAAELHSRCEIMQENYCKVLSIEAKTMLEMAKKQIIPAVNAYSGTICSQLSAITSCGIAPLGIKDAAKKAVALSDRLYLAVEELEQTLDRLTLSADGIDSSALLCKNDLLPAMHALRSVADEAETVTPANLWPFPTYGELLFNV